MKRERGQPLFQPLSVPCPTCKAAAGRPCVLEDGRVWYLTYHFSRLTLARNQARRMLNERKS